jgi:hypothetical protein
VLIVDDHEVNRYTTGRVLRAHGYSIVEAGTGAEAIEAAEKHSPDLVLLDVNLPDMDGFETCQRMRADPQQARMAIVHISATFVSNSDRAHGLDSGADGYLTRPVEPVVLAATARACIRARHAEAEVKRRERELAALAENMPDLIVRFDTSMRYTFVNGVAQRMMGLSQEEMLGRTSREIGMPAGACDRLEDRLARAIATGEPQTLSFELPVDGEMRTFDARLIPERRADGAIDHVLGIAQDVTARRQLEQERDRMLESERAARGAADRAARIKDEFIATLSHELRTPMHAILGWTEILQRRGDDPAAVKKGLAVILRNAQAQAEMINDLLDLNRIMSGKLRLNEARVDLADAVRVTADAMMPLASTKGVHVAVRTPASAAFVIADADRILQVISNLLGNAIKFTPAGGRIDLAVEASGDHVKLTVRDTGIGIDPAFLPHLFDRFSQADATAARTHGGLGIGLSIVKQIVVMSGGTIEATSDGAGLGSTFVVKLPAAPAMTSNHAGVGGAKLTDAPAGLVDVDLSGVSVLLVDDQADAREVVERLLAEAGATVRSVSSASDALDLLSQGAPPDLLLSDLGMPRMSGYELIECIRAQHAIPASRMPAIAISAYTRDADRDRTLGAGFQAHLAKPLQPDVLLKTVSQWGRHKSA